MSSYVSRAALVTAFVTLAGLPLVARQAAVAVPQPSAPTPVNLQQVLPFDAAVKTGRLPNGLTYYVRRNSRPANRVVLRMAVKTGSLDEADDQQGLAHMLEHMAFNGSEHFKPGELVSYFESVGARLGPHVNAQTGFEDTIYMLDLPTDKPVIVEKGLTAFADFAGGLTLDPTEIDKERGVVIQEIARANDTPSMVAEHLIDRAAMGEHPLGRPVLGPPDHLRTFSRDAIVAFRERQWAGPAGGAFIVGNLDHVSPNGDIDELFTRFPSHEPPPSPEPAPAFEPHRLVEPRESNQSHLRMSYRAAVDVSDRKQRAALGIYSTLLGGSMGSRLFDEIREQRGLAYSVYGVDHAHADAAIVQLGAGLDSDKAVEAFERMGEIVEELRRDGPTEAEVERARAYAGGRLVLGFENTLAVARHAATSTIVHREPIDPDGAIATVDAVTHAEVCEIATAISENLAVAVVGPHEAADFGG